MKSDNGPESRSGLLARYGTLIARLLFAPLLLGYAAMKVRALMGSVQADALQSFPVAQVALYLTILVEFAGGMMLVLGYRTRLAAAALIVLFIGVTGLMLPMIGAPGGMGMAYVDQIVKNLAFIGGLVMLAVHGAGPVSLDARRERRVATR
ncbi:MAG: DoxX family protein [Pseudomonadota bacterium]